jgi:hypothetical protein
MWSVAQEWSSSNTFSWTPTVGGNYRIGVWAKSFGNPSPNPEAFAGIDFNITVTFSPADFAGTWSGSAISAISGPFTMTMSINTLGQITGGSTSFGQTIVGVSGQFNIDPTSGSMSGSLLIFQPNFGSFTCNFTLQMSTSKTTFTGSGSCPAIGDTISSILMDKQVTQSFP